jgi:hypothetical protein
MADIPADLDITVDLNGQSADVQPYHGDAVPMNQQPAPAVTPEKVADDKPAPSLRDTLTDAFKGETAPKVGEAPKPAETPGQSENKPELVKVGERFHRKDGSFASKEEIDAFNAPVAEGGQQPPAPVPAWASNLTELERTQLASLPAETRQFVERTMEGVNQRSAQLQEYDMLEQVIGPRREPWSQNGMTPLVAINELFALSDFAGRDPGEFVMWFANQHRLDLDALLDARDAAQAANGGEIPPYVSGLQQQIAQLQNTIGGLTNTTVQQTTAQNMRHVQTFIEEKDASGNLAHPYFNDVATQVAQHVQLIRQQQPYLPERDILKAAYDFATFNNPEIRGKMQADTLKAQQDAAAAEAARARAAGVSINGGPAGDSSQAPNNANRTLREELQHAYSQNTLQ